MGTSSLIKPTVKDLMVYLNQKRIRLAKIKARLCKHPAIDSLFINRDWYKRIEEQICLWEKNKAQSLISRDITIPEYELFRCFEDYSVFLEFIKSFNELERNTLSNRTKYRNWNETKSRLFSKKASQIFSGLFEVLTLGKLLVTTARVEPYFNNVDGRLAIDKRYICFEIKSLQKTSYDLVGVGVGGVMHDKHQIITTLVEKAQQLSPYNYGPLAVFLSLYRLADTTTAEWFIQEFFDSPKGINISVVVLYSWFTARKAEKILINRNAKSRLAAMEIEYFCSYL